MSDKKTYTGTTYGGRGRAMEDIAQANVKCYNCNEMGHFAVNCPKKKKSIKSTTFYCNWCKKPGHYAKDCRSRIQNQKKTNYPKKNYKK